MLKLAADENIESAVVSGLLRLVPPVDIVRVQDFGLSGASDPDVLEWAAHAERILISHDFRTMNDAFYARKEIGAQRLGLVLMAETLPIGRALEELLLFVQVSSDNEWDGRVMHLPERS